MIKTVFYSDFLHNYFLLTFVFLILAYLISVFSYYVVHRKIKLSNFRFSYRNYYIMVSPFLLPPLFIGFLEGTLIYFLVFLYFGFFGVMGEIIFSILWKIYFKKPFWEYKLLTIANKFSSLLNFIPWGVGGFLFLLVTNTYINNSGNIFYQEMSIGEMINVFILATSLFILQIFLFKVIVKLFSFKRENRKIILIKYFYFVSSFFLIGIFMPIYYFDYLVLFFFYGIFAFFAEYLFGKMSKTIIGKKLWTYEYLTIDKKHTTPLNIFPFGLAGYYFFFLFLFLSFFV